METTQYRTKPVVIDAVQWTGDNYPKVGKFAGSAVYITSPRGLTVITAEGPMTADVGDFIVKDEQGFFPCTPDVFAMTYAPVDLNHWRSWLLFGDWLSRTQELQIEAYGTDPAALTGAEHADFVTWNCWALVQELGEMMDEYPGWKPWVKERGKDINRDRMVQEMVDVLHFAANILVALKCTDEELNTRYVAKMDVNAKRQEDGYDGVKDDGKAQDEPALPWLPSLPPLPEPLYAARCFECDMELGPVMNYVCFNSKCPTGLGGVQCSSTST